MHQTISSTPRGCLKQPGKSSSKNRSSNVNAKKSKVSFKSKKVIRKIPLLSAYSPEDIDAIWYGNREVNWIMEQVNQLVIQAEESPEGATIRDIDGECLRGLERKTTDGHTEAFLARIAVYEAVLDEQENQWKQPKNGEQYSYDHDKIAALCQQASTDSKKAALLRAKQDEAAVQAYLYKEGPFLHQKEPELDLQQVFSKAQNHKQTKRSSSPSSDSWATASTESTTSSTSTSSTSSSYEAESDTEVSIASAASSASSSSNVANASGKRSSFTTAKKISTPAVPRPNAPKRKIPNRAKNLSFQKSNEPAIRRQLGIEPRKHNTNTNTNIKKDTAIRPNTVIQMKPTPTPTEEIPKKKVVKRKSKGLSLECSAFIQ